MREKKCSKCEVLKPLDEFHKNKDGKYGCRSTCKECEAEYDKQKYKKNKEKKKAYSKQYYQENREERLEWQKQYKKDNKEKINEYERNRKANDPVVALRHNVNNLINRAFKRSGGSKLGESVFQYLPYTFEELKEHLESQFEPGMTWNKRSEWHIDHIYPHSLLPYDSMDHPNFQKAWALENLQPLWAKENITKGKKIIGET